MNRCQRLPALVILICNCLVLFAQQTTPCDRPEQKQFDFWVGDWDLTSPGTKSGEVVHSSNTIKRILGSCIVQENFVGSDASDQAPQNFPARYNYPEFA